MQRNDVTPIGDLRRRPPEAGRIRLGVQVKIPDEPGKKQGRTRPEKVKTFRFTSPKRNLIEQLAALYGGTVEEWNEPRSRNPHQFQVLSSTDQIQVWVTPGGLDQDYELWPGPERRCDGIVCRQPRPAGFDDYEEIEVPCICVAEQNRKCELYTRMTLLLPQLTFEGTWRCETKGWNAAAELPGVFELLEMYAARNQMLRAKLTLEQRSSVNPATKKKRNYVVPVLSIEENLAELVAGHAGVDRQLSAGGRPELANPAQLALPSPAVSSFDPDVEPVEAMEVDDELLEIESMLIGDADEFGMDRERFMAAMYRKVGVTTSADDEQRKRLREAHRQIAQKEIVPMGFTATGDIQWGRP